MIARMYGVRKLLLVDEIREDVGILLSIVAVRAERRVEVRVLLLVQLGDPLELRRVERHVLVRRIRRLVGRERVATHEVLDAIDAHENRVARIHAVAIAGIQMAGDRQPVKVRALDERAQLVRRDALCLEALDAELRPVIHFGVDLLRA